MVRGRKFKGDFQGRFFFTQSTCYWEHTAWVVMEAEIIKAFKRPIDKHVDMQ